MNVLPVSDPGVQDNLDAVSAALGCTVKSICIGIGVPPADAAWGFLADENDDVLIEVEFYSQLPRSEIVPRPSHPIQSPEAFGEFVRRAFS